MDTLLNDLRYAARMLLRRPGFAVVAGLTLALGIGANSAVFSLLEALLLRPLPFRDPGRLVMVWERNAREKQDRNSVGPYNYFRWRERARSFQDMAAFVAWQANVTGQGEPERVETAVATGNLFEVLGAPALVGRTLAPVDSEPGAPGVVVLSEGYWHRRFGGDPTAVGRDLTVNGQPRRIVGVVPASLRVPPAALIWLPIEASPELRESSGRFLRVVGRLKPGVTVAQAREEMTGVAAVLSRENPNFNTGWSVNVQPLHADLVRDVRPAVRLLMGAAGLLLLLACGNVANLLLARAVAREREMAIRGSLGASTTRLVRQLLTESLLLALAGGAIGLLLGGWILQGLRAILPAELPLLAAIELNPMVAAFAGALAVLSAVVFGLVPALTVSRPSLVGVLREGGSVRGSGRRRLRFKHGLVVLEVAMSLLLAAGAGLLLRSFWRLSGVDPGFDPRGVLTVQLDLPGNRYEERSRQAAFFMEAVERLAELPEVRAVGAISWMPLGPGSGTSYRLYDRPQPPPGQEPGGDVRIVTPGFFRALAIPLLKGRDFTGADRAGTTGVVIINKAAAERFWPGQDPIGRRVGMDWFEDPQGVVVGVVGDVRLNALDTAAEPVLYWPVAQVPNYFMSLMVRTSGDPQSAAAGVRHRLRALDPDLPLTRMRPLAAVVDQSLQRQRFVMILIGAFAAAALLLAGVGIYGVMSYTVMQRVPEVGVRMALGARPRDVRKLILRHGLVLGAMGVAAGLAGALALGRILASLLYQVSPRDPASLVAVAAVLMALVVGATWLPARRAAKVDPLAALRTD